MFEISAVSIYSSLPKVKFFGAPSLLHKLDHKLQVSTYFHFAFISYYSELKDRSIEQNLYVYTEIHNYVCCPQYCEATFAILSLRPQNVPFCLKRLVYCARNFSIIFL